MKTYEDEAFDDIDKAQQRKVATGVTDGSIRGCMTQDEAFKKWWYNEGSQAPYTHHDCEEHTMRMCEIAWANGAFVEREVCAKLCEQVAKPYQAAGASVALECASIIRARAQADGGEA